jgi:hypothetical protein
MKKLMILSCAMLLFFGITGIANARLIDRGGGLIYDDVLDITWLQDANYPQTNGDDADGVMFWEDARAWADGLEYYDSVRSVTWDDWRLPHTLPVNGNSFNIPDPPNPQISDLDGRGLYDIGYNISAPGSAFPGSPYSELAYMYFINLGNLGFKDTSGAGNQPGWSSTPKATFIDGNGNTVSFQNLQADGYWSGTEFVPSTQDRAWWFAFRDGFQYQNGWSSNFYAWAVRDGDVSTSTPEPPSGGGGGSGGCFIDTLSFK